MHGYSNTIRVMIRPTGRDSRVQYAPAPWYAAARHTCQVSHISRGCLMAPREAAIRLLQRFVKHRHGLKYPLPDIHVSEKHNLPEAETCVSETQIRLLGQNGSRVPVGSMFRIHVGSRGEKSGCLFDCFAAPWYYPESGSRRAGELWLQPSSSLGRKSKEG